MSIDDRPTIAAPDDDPYLWLEDIEGERALDFVTRQTALTLKKFGNAGFARDRDILAAIYYRPDNIPYVMRRGGLLYNLWKNANKTSAVCRGTQLQNFHLPNPNRLCLMHLERT